MHWREKSQTKPEKGNGFAGGGHRQLLSPCACYAGIFCICYLQMSVSVRNYTTPPHYAPPPLLLSIPDCLRRWPCSLLARRRRRRRGRRGGLAIKLKVFLRLHREPQLQLGFHAECLARETLYSLALAGTSAWMDYFCVSHLGGAAPCNPLSSVECARTIFVHYLGQIRLWIIWNTRLGLGWL